MKQQIRVQCPALSSVSHALGEASPGCCWPGPEETGGPSEAPGGKVGFRFPRGERPRPPAWPELPGPLHTSERRWSGIPWVEVGSPTGPVRQWTVERLLETPDARPPRGAVPGAASGPHPPLSGAARRVYTTTRRGTGGAAATWAPGREGAAPPGRYCLTQAGWARGAARTGRAERPRRDPRPLTSSLRPPPLSPLVGAL